MTPRTLARTRAIWLYVSWWGKHGLVPTVRELAVTHGCSVSTAAQAVRHLEQLGYVKRACRGSFRLAVLVPLLEG